MTSSNVGHDARNWVQWLLFHYALQLHNYEEIVAIAKQQFFAESNASTDEERYEYFLVDPQGSKLMNSIAGKPWSLAQYIHVHGYYPSKTKIYCVQVCAHGKLHMHFSMVACTPFSVTKVKMI